MNDTTENANRSWVRELQLTAPALADNVADADRLVGVLKETYGADVVHVGLELLRGLPTTLRECDYRVRTCCFRDQRGLHLVGVAPADDGTPLVGVAVDLGTTRVVLRCLDLETGAALGETIFDNPQIAVAPDILARIHHADTPGGLEQLQQLIVGEINARLTALRRDAGIEKRQVCLAAVAGNTAMSQLFLGLDPHWIIREPYIPAANSFGLLPARDVGFDLAPGGGLFLFPNIGSYFGGDLIAGILHAGLHRAGSEEPAIMVDVGTNAEVVLGNGEWLLACAGAAGPALESGAASMGMMAGPGVIDRVALDGITGALQIHTIEDAPPLGICGSGLIDLAACLFRLGLVDIRGELDAEACGDRFVIDDEIKHYVVVDAAASGTGAALTISQLELDSLVRSKAAMFTILETITSAVGLTPEELSTFYVAGTFGCFIDAASAITIGMLPDLPLSTYVPLGNSSLGGATLALTSPEAAAEIAAIRDAITYLELNVNQEFMNRFSAAKFLPHTNPERFPSVKIPR